MSTLHAEATSPAALRAGLTSALRNAGAPGPDGVTVSAFEAIAEDELAALAADLVTGAYQPIPARAVQIPKSGGGHRHLAIPCVRDRVVAHALAATLSRALDDRLHDSAFAYRRGRSVKAALKRIDADLRQGRAWIMRADIQDFFDSVPRPALLASLERETGEPELCELVSRLLGAGVVSGSQVLDSEIGLPQGSPLSPFLANLYLAPFDAAMELAGIRMVRYGDDLCATAITRAEAERALTDVERALRRLSLGLNAQKVALRHVGQGFTYLGFHFTPYGRRPADKSGQRLASRLRELGDAPAEVDALLRGWPAYYGSFAGVELPAEALAAGRALERDHAERHHARALEAAPEVEPASWVTRARALAGDVASADALREELSIEPEAWDELRGALVAGELAQAAEQLARLGRFSEADELMAGSALTDPPPVAEPVLRSGVGDAELLLERFGGAEHTFARARAVDGRFERARVDSAPAAADARAHLAGESWMGVYPLRADRSVSFVAARVVLSGKARRAGDALLAEAWESVRGQARRVASAMAEAGHGPLVSSSPDAGTSAGCSSTHLPGPPELAPPSTRSSPRSARRPRS